MAKLVYLVAVSADGFIAGPDGAFDFFPNAGDHLSAQAQAFPETLPSPLRTILGATQHAVRFGSVVMGVDDEPFEEVLEAARHEAGVTNDADLPPEKLKEVTAKFKAIVKAETGTDFPDEPVEQLKLARRSSSRGTASAPRTTARPRAFPMIWARR